MFMIDLKVYIRIKKEQNDMMEPAYFFDKYYIQE